MEEDIKLAADHWSDEVIEMMAEIRRHRIYRNGPGLYASDKVFAIVKEADHVVRKYNALQKKMERKKK